MKEGFQWHQFAETLHWWQWWQLGASWDWHSTNCPWLVELHLDWKS